jgi:SRSO17 transposase
LPADTTSATKQPLGVRMLERLVGRVLAAWVAADAVYGPDTWLRAWLEGRGLGYVLGIRAVDRVTVVAGEGDLVRSRPAI